jgi:hypothetical protein
MLTTVYNGVVYQKIFGQDNAMVLGLETDNKWGSPINVKIVDKVQIGKNSYPVIRIKEDAFAYQQLNEVELPSIIRHIGRRAFTKSTVKTIRRNPHILKQAVTIENYAFSSCPELKKVCFNGPVSFGVKVFEFCPELQAIDSFNFCNLPDSIFALCGLESLYVSELLKDVQPDALKDSKIKDVYFLEGSKIEISEHIASQFKGKILHVESDNPIVNLAFEGYRVMIEERT